MELRIAGCEMAPRSGKGPIGSVFRAGLLGWSVQPSGTRGATGVNSNGEGTIARRTPVPRTSSVPLLSETGSHNIQPACCRGANPFSFDEAHLPGRTRLPFDTPFSSRKTVQAWRKFFFAIFFPVLDFSQTAPSCETAVHNESYKHASVAKRRKEKERKGHTVESLGTFSGT